MLLDSPAHPVRQGQDVSLACRCSCTDSSCSAASTFYKDGVLQGPGGAAAVLTLHNVSLADEGFYACELNGRGRSPPSWLAVRGEQLHHPQPPKKEPRDSVLPPTGQETPAPAPAPAPPFLLLLLLRHLLVGTPLLLSTLLLGLIHRDRGEVEEEVEEEVRCGYAANQETGSCQVIVPL